MRFWRGAAASSAASTVSTNIPSESENEILARHHKFVMSHDDFAASQASWETRMAAKYYRRLFKEVHNSVVIFSLCWLNTSDSSIAYTRKRAFMFL